MIVRILCGSGAMVMPQFDVVAVAPVDVCSLSTVNANDPATPGVPVIAPVLGFKTRGDGSEPEFNANVKGAAPLLTMIEEE